jgi:alpha-galactosidase
MTRLITVQQAGLHFAVRVTPTGDVRLVQYSALSYNDTCLSEEQERDFRMVEVQCTGMDRSAHHGTKHVGTQPGHRLRYVFHYEEPNPFGHTLSIVQHDQETGVRVTSSFQFFHEIPVLRAWTTLTNEGTSALGLEYLSSFALTGLAQHGSASWNQKMRVSIPHNYWYGEAQWHSYTLPEVGLTHVTAVSTKSVSVTSLGTWSSGQFLPMGYLENVESGEGWLWQIEHNGSWQWEVGEQAGDLYLHLSGPTDQEHQWWKQIEPGESFTSVPVALALGQRNDHYSTFEHCMHALTQYRRHLVRRHSETSVLHVIFNDYMNCLEGDPTETKELPLIKQAAEVGCEVYCIDAGWYADQGSNWWDSVGAWEPSTQRFPHGLAALCTRIREFGMIPGLWLELEVMGINSPLARTFPDSWFFCCHGQRVIDHGRFQLDFRHPDVRAFATVTVERLIKDYGIGYIKMDYNINSGVGTEYEADSPGDGLLHHNRAYLTWLESIFTRYPDLIIENCGSGGMRMDYASLSHYSLQSASDQTDYRKMAVIAAAIPTAVLPEQAGIWSYPLATDDAEAVICNMINALLGRIHLSGQLASLNGAQLALVKEAIYLYKTLRADLGQSLPFWPLGLPTMASEWTSLGLLCGSTMYLAVWRLGSQHEQCFVPLPLIGQEAVEISCIYPHSEASYTPDEANLVSLVIPTTYSARLLKIHLSAAKKDN